MMTAHNQTSFVFVSPPPLFHFLFSHPIIHLRKKSSINSWARKRGKIFTFVNSKKKLKTVHLVLFSLTLFRLKVSLFSSFLLLPLWDWYFLFLTCYSGKKLNERGGERNKKGLSWNTWKKRRSGLTSWEKFYTCFLFSLLLFRLSFLSLSEKKSEVEKSTFQYLCSFDEEGERREKKEINKGGHEIFTTTQLNRKSHWRKTAGFGKKEGGKIFFPIV